MTSAPLPPAAPETPRQRYGYLPACLMTVLAVVGEDAMLKLVATLGGTRLHLGRKPAASGKLVEAVGLDAAEIIQNRFALDKVTHIDVPVMSSRLARQRLSRILALRAEGVKVADVARRLGVTERGVYDACARARADAADQSRQLSLFG